MSQKNKIAILLQSQKRISLKKKIFLLLFALPTRVWNWIVMFLSRIILLAFLAVGCRRFFLRRFTFWLEKSTYPKKLWKHSICAAREKSFKNTAKILPLILNEHFRNLKHKLFFSLFFFEGASNMRWASFGNNVRKACEQIVHNTWMSHYTSWKLWIIHESIDGEAEERGLTHIHTFIPYIDQ